jgi:hypothetical protein
MQYIHRNFIALEILSKKSAELLERQIPGPFYCAKCKKSANFLRPQYWDTKRQFERRFSAAGLAKQN